MDYDRASKEKVDPTYLWVGPNEKTLTGKISFVCFLRQHLAM
jgi:hypothetical protein